MSGAFDVVPSSFICLKTGLSSSWRRIQQRDAEQDDRDQERYAPAPVGEGGFAHRRANDDDDAERREQAERRGGLDEAGEKAAFPLGCMFGDIGGGAAIFAAEREPLDEAEEDKEDRRRDADRRVAREHADEEGRRAHEAHGDEEGVLAPDEIADAAEHERAERPYSESLRRRRRARR